MAVEIKELVIKATVTGQAQAPAGSPGAAGDGMNEQEIINQCVSEVLKILQREKER